jgi:hypothetical protein
LYNVHLVLLVSQDSPRSFNFGIDPTLLGDPCFRFDLKTLHLAFLAPRFLIDLLPTETRQLGFEQAFFRL